MPLRKGKVTLMAWTLKYLLFHIFRLSVDLKVTVVFLLSYHKIFRTKQQFGKLIVFMNIVNSRNINISNF